MRKNILYFFAIAVVIIAVSIACINPGSETTTTTSTTSTTEAPTAVNFLSAVQTGGGDGTKDSTGLILTFDVNPATLATSDITVTGAAGGVLSGSGTTRLLTIFDITVDNNKDVTVDITSPEGYLFSGSPQTAAVYRATIGIPYQGGVIAYVYPSGSPGYVAGETHGIIAALSDLSSGYTWYNGTYEDTGATDLIVGTGRANTDAIVSVQGAGSYAAKACDDYVNLDTGTGVYDDWYLPSKDELTEIYLNKTTVGGFINGAYWSSSESTTNNAWQIMFDSGNKYSSSKSGLYQVRAVRSF